MVDEELLDAISQMMDAKLKPIRQDIADIKETLGEHTTALNTLIEWADDVQVVVKIPFGKS